MSLFCPICGGTITVPRGDCPGTQHVAPHPRSREFEAARVADPERVWWDDFEDGGIERPGDDE